MHNNLPVFMGLTVYDGYADQSRPKQMVCVQLSCIESFVAMYDEQHNNTPYTRLNLIGGSIYQYHIAEPVDEIVEMLKKFNNE